MLLSLLVSVSLAHYSLSSTGAIGVQLFQWSFKSIAKECQFLGESGYSWVQTSPIAAHPKDCADGQLYPWYLAYQPIAYSIGNRLGSEQDFKDMVSECKANGIDIVVDAVLNHASYVNLSNSTGFGTTKPWSAQAFNENFQDSGLTSANFHDSKCNANVNYESDQNQWVATLVDIATETNFVRTSIAEFLNKLLSFGVVGFRTDLATYIPSDDWRAVKSLMIKNYKGEDAFFAQEAYPLPSSGDYQDYPTLGRIISVSGNGYANSVGRAFRNMPKDGNPNSPLQFTDMLQDIINNQPIGSEKAVTFIENHDQERNQDGQTSLPLFRLYSGWYYYQAMAFNILYPFGLSQIHSGYNFNWRGGDDAHREIPISAPHDLSGYILPVVINADGSCSKEWDCQHRKTPILQLVKIRAYIGKDTKVSAIRSAGHGSNQIWWSTSKSFVAINSAQNQQSNMDMLNSVQTGLPPGTYCNMMYAQMSSDGVCNLLPGTFLSPNYEQISYRVDASGMVTLNIRDADKSRVLAFYTSADGYRKSSNANNLTNVTFQLKHKLVAYSNYLAIVGTFNNWSTCATSLKCSTIDSLNFSCGPISASSLDIVQWKAIEVASVDCKLLVWSPSPNQVFKPTDQSSQIIHYSF